MDLPLKGSANGSLEIHNDGITVTSRIIAQEREPLQSTIIIKPDEIPILQMSGKKSQCEIL